MGRPNDRIANKPPLKFNEHSGFNNRAKRDKHDNHERWRRCGIQPGFCRRRPSLRPALRLNHHLNVPYLAVITGGIVRFIQK